MKQKSCFIVGTIFVLAFIVWTILICLVDVQAVGVNGTKVGLAGLNCWFHKLTGVNMSLYYVSDWLGLVPVGICIFFGGMGLVQLIKRKSLFKVDADLIILGVYYLLVIVGYLVFEMIPINYRPILIEGKMEVSYPSSTTLLVLSVMPTVAFEVKRRTNRKRVKQIINSLVGLFSIFMVIARTVSGVHWLTDIIGSIIISLGIYLLFKATVLYFQRGEKDCGTR